MLNKIIIANIISFICIVIEQYTLVEVDRHKSVLMWAIQHFLYAISYFILNTYTMMYISIYAIFKHSYTYIKYRNKEVVYNKIEAILLNLPYLIIGIIGKSNEGILGLLYGLATFGNGMGFVFKSDKNRYIDYLVTNSYKAFYNFYNLNFTGGLNYVLSIISILVGMVKIKKEQVKNG